MGHIDAKEKEKTYAYIRHIAGCIIFLVLLVFLFTRITYILRESTYDRLHTVGLSAEDVDMIYIGGSAAFVYWQPLKAWHDNGLTSYLYAHNTMSAETIRYFIQESQKSQDAKLYVIDVRPFQYWDEQGDQSIRNALTGMDVFSMNRWRLIDTYFSTRDTSNLDDRVTFDWDIIKYHTVTENLASSASWKLINNSREQPNKGFEWVSTYEYLNSPVDYSTDARAELHPTCQAILIDLLEYCKREDFDVLFVVCPYVINEAHQKTYNTISDIIMSYGFDFLNTNTDVYYDEMGIDFSTDFYNINHVNNLGAAKYTAFLEKYITDHYNLPDHAGDLAYSSWDEEYQRFEEQEAAHISTVTGRINRAKDGIDIAEHIASADNVFEWNSLVLGDDRFTVLFAQNGEMDLTEIAEQRVAEQWGLSSTSAGGIRVMSNRSVIFSNAGNGQTTYSGSIAPTSGQSIGYTVSNEAGEISIIVDGVEYAPNQEGINFVVINNNYRTVVDVLAVTCEDGHLVMTR